MDRTGSNPAVGMSCRDGHLSDADRCSVVRGETDMTGCEQVRVFLRQCRRALTGHCRGLLLDLSEVRIADSKLVACLVLVHQAAQRDHVGVNVSASDAVQNLIGLYRLDRLLSNAGPS